MATKPINTAAIEKGTGRSWEDWLAFLKSIDAEKLSHKEIAERVAATGDATGWWSQSIAVAFEQSIGRRVPGQDNDGTFQVSATKTLPGTMDEALVAWAALVGDRKEFVRRRRRARSRNEPRREILLLALRPSRRLARLDELLRQVAGPGGDRPRPREAQVAIRRRALARLLEGAAEAALRTGQPMPFGMTKGTFSRRKHRRSSSRPVVPA